MEKRRALIAGAGNFGSQWGDTVINSDRAELVAWVDARVDVVNDAAARRNLQSVHIGSDLGEALDASSPDFVINVTVPSSHRQVTVQCLEAGFPVLCEKPMAGTLEDALAMVAASENTGRLLVISQQRRYDAGLAATRRLIADHLGKLGILSSDFYRGHPAGGFRDEMVSPLLQDMAIHTFDAARYLCGADPVSVYCEHFNPPWSWYPGHACATALFDMTGGLKYTYRGCWTNQGFDTAWEAEWRAIGPHGTVLWDGLSAPRAEIGGEPGTFPIDIMRETEALDPAMATWLEGSLLAFIDGMDSGRAPMGECHDNLKSLAMVFGAVESAVTGQRIQISELLQGSSASPCHEM